MTRVEEFDEAVAAAQHLDDGRYKALIGATRALARKADAWDVIVEWAERDADERGGRPVVPANDNVTLASYMKGLAALGLTPESAAKLDLAQHGRPNTTKGADDDDDEPVDGARITTAEAFRRKAAERASSGGSA